MLGLPSSYDFEFFMINKARYLIRFDDICPMMNWRIWAEIEAILLEKKVKPILDVVPDNQDPHLIMDHPVPDSGIVFAPGGRTGGPSPCMAISTNTLLREKGSWVSIPIANLPGFRAKSRKPN